MAVPATEQPLIKESQFNYLAYGLRLCSNAPVPGLRPAEQTGIPPDVKVNLGTLPTRGLPRSHYELRYVSPYLTELGEPALKIWEVDGGAFLQMSYCDGIEFWLDRRLETLWASWPENLTIEHAICYLVGPVLGFLLRLRGFVCLHASVVAIKGRAAVFVGHEGAGKSTTAACFAKRGFAVLSDDIAALVELENIFHVLPAYPRVNLWPHSVELLYGTPEALPQMMSGLDKRCLLLGKEQGPQFEERVLPIGGIYIFGDPSDKSEGSLEPLPLKSALLMLVACTYATNSLNAQQRAEEFAVLGRLVTAVSVRKINAKRGILRVDELCEVIQRDFSSLK
jgi:hypothetical protein